MDIDVVNALKQREGLVGMVEADVRSSTLDRDTRDLSLAAFGRLREAKVYVWEPTALAAVKRFLSDDNQHKAFDRLCRDSTGSVRLLPSLIEDSFHFFPAEGLVSAHVPADLHDPGCDAILPPRTSVIAIGHLKAGALDVYPMLLNVLYLDPKKLPADAVERTRVFDFLLRLPPRDIPPQRWIMEYLRTQTLVAARGQFLFDQPDPSWLLPFYALRVFLDQPFAGVKKSRPSKGLARRTGVPKHEVATTVYMRDAPSASVKRWVFQRASLMTGRKLEYEVDVRGHVRHCHSGKVVEVKPHKRGPRGVKREHVFKMIR